MERWKSSIATTSSSVDVSPGPPPPLQSFSPGSLTPTSSNSSQSPHVNWADTFVIPWDKFPEELTQTLEREKRPSPRLRREMVRLVVQEMTQKSSCISRRSSIEVAKKMVSKYPKSLQDVIEGDVIGQGYHSLVNQLQNRIENVKRSTTPIIRKRRYRTDDSDTDEVPPEKRAAIQDTYWCITWDPKFLPLGETPESQKEKGEKMNEEHFLLPV